MKYLEVAKTNLEFLIDNLSEDVCEISFILNKRDDENGYFIIDRIKEMFYKEICDCHPELENVRVTGTVYKNQIKITYEICGLYK